MNRATAVRLARLTHADCETDYLDRLKRFRAVAGHLGTSLSTAIAARVRQFSLRNHQADVELLDVGSSDGTLLYEALGGLDASVPLTKALALEPDSRSFAALTRNRQLVRYKVQPDRCSLEEFLSRPNAIPSRFNVVLLSHVFYHFADPVAVVRAITARLPRPALLIVILDSHENPLYRFMDRARHLSSLTPTATYGDYLSAEMLKENLTQVFNISDQANLDSIVNIRSLSEFIDTLEFLGRRVVSSSAAIDDVRHYAATVGFAIIGRHAVGQSIFSIEQ